MNIKKEKHLNLILIINLFIHHQLLTDNNPYAHLIENAVEIPNI